MQTWIATLSLITSAGVLLIAILLFRQFDHKLREEIRRLEQRDWNKKKEDSVMKRNTLILSVIMAIALSMGVASIGFAAVKKGKTPAKPAATIQDHIDAVAVAYVAIQDKLSGDSVKDVNKHAKAILKSVDAALVLAKKDEKMNQKLIESLGRVKTSAKEFNKDKLTLTTARASFYPLSMATVVLVNEHLSQKQADKYALFYCPMAEGYWLQKDKKNLRNPYEGSKMLTCGKAVDYGKDFDHTKCKGCDKHMSHKLKDSGHEAHEKCMCGSEHKDGKDSGAHEDHAH